VIPVDGSALRQLPPDDPRSQWNARYSPDGTDVAFISQDGLAVADADGSHSRVLVPGALAGWYQGPVWSPTGDRIVFASRSDGGPTELRVVDVASGTVVSLADMRATADFPGFVIRFSPEGDQVLFARANRKSGIHCGAFTPTAPTPPTRCRGRLGRLAEADPSTLTHEALSATAHA
jgi:Tol biopolymer transport system component